jgi:diguanylate cyclase (GGDEF)-like protein
MTGLNASLAERVMVGRWSAAGRVMPPPAWLTWTIVGSAIIVAYLALGGEPLQQPVYDALAFAAAGTVVLGIVRYRPRPTARWWLLAFGIALLAVGDVLYDVLASMGEESEPSLADIVYLVGSAILCGAAALMLRGRARPLTALLDAFVIGSAFAIVLWTFVVGPRIDEGALSLPAFATLAAYPVLDVAMLAILVVALLGGQPLDRSTGLFAAAVLAFLASDLAYAVIAATSEYGPGLIDVGWLLGYVLWGAAALAIRPSTERQSPVEWSEPRVWRAVRPIVWLAAVTAPLVNAVMDEVWFGGGDAFAAAVASVVVSIAVIIRLEHSLREKRRLLDDRHRLEATLQRQATEDPLTDLPNRRGLAERLVQALAEPDKGIALLVLDLDDFKAVNDALGHQAGDELLRAVADRLRSVVRGSDTVARYGGDEFAVVLRPCPSAEVATRMADRLLGSLEAPIAMDRGEVTVRVSIGIALSARTGADAEHLLRDADLALYRAKSAGKDRWALLDPEASAMAVRSLSIASELARALEDGEFALGFQPIISLTDGTIESFEALLRWDHPTLGMLLPGEFLPAAERSVHMPAIGRWVIEQACSAAAGWQRLGVSDVGVSVNISAAQLADDAFPDIVLRTLRDTGLKAGLLTIEVLESALDATPALGESLGRLRDAGVRLAIDDFGTGYSALSRVAEIPVTELKLDRSLVAGASDQRMVGAIVRLGQTLGLRLVAEGVESGRELKRVRALGCDAAQGYRICKPVAGPEVAPLLLSWAPARTSARPPLAAAASIAG